MGSSASVEFVPHRGTNYARSRLPEFVGKAQRGFSTVSRELPYGQLPYFSFSRTQSSPQSATL